MATLYQATTGSVLALLAGDPVGRAIGPIAGMPEALQATALARPQLGRVPKGGVRFAQLRNVWDGIPLGPLSTDWAQSGFRVRAGTDGVTVEVIAVGYEGGEPFITLRYSGTNTHASIQFLNLINDDVWPIGNTTHVTCSVKATLLDGSLGAGSSVASLSLYANYREAAGGLINGNSIYVPLILGTEVEGKITQPHREAAVSITNRGCYIRVPVGGSVNATVKYRGMRVALSETLPAFQLIYGPNDARQVGTPDVWHLASDGIDDTLNVSLTAGTYTVSWVDHLGVVTIEEGVAVSGVQNILRSPRLADYHCINRPLSYAEKLAITAYWQQRYKA